jgi:3-phytase
VAKLHIHWPVRHTMSTFVNCLVWASTFLALVQAQAANITLIPVSASFDGDNTGFLYARSPLLLANDGSAADGGFRTFAVSKSAPVKQATHQKTGRSKVVVPVHDIGGRDLIINIPAPDSLIRVFDAETGRKVDSNDKKQLGDWSSACVWRSPKSGESYLFLFGKKTVVQFIVRSQKKGVEILEVRWSQSKLDSYTNFLIDPNIPSPNRRRDLCCLLQRSDFLLR